MARNYTEGVKNSNRNWDAKHLDRISIALQKGMREIIKDHAASMGESMNAWIGRAITETIESDKKRGAP